MFIKKQINKKSNRKTSSEKKNPSLDLNFLNHFRPMSKFPFHSSVLENIVTEQSIAV